MSKGRRRLRLREEEERERGRLPSGNGKNHTARYSRYVGAGPAEGRSDQKGGTVRGQPRNDRERRKEISPGAKDHRCLKEAYSTKGAEGFRG